MTAYNTMDQALVGMESGILGRKEGGWACREISGIGFGKPVFGYRGDQKGAYNFYNDTAKIAFDADFIADNTINGVVNGVAIAEVTYTDSHAATMLLLIAAYAALTGVEAVLDSTDSNGRTLLVQAKGSVNVSTSVVTNGNSQATATITYGSSQVFVGVALMTQNDTGTQDLPGYAKYDAVNVMCDGVLWVEAKATVKANKDA